MNELQEEEEDIKIKKNSRKSSQGTDPMGHCHQSWDFLFSHANEWNQKFRNIRNEDSYKTIYWLPTGIKSV